MSWTVTIEAPCTRPWLNANDRIHWSKRRRLTKAWREAAGWALKAAKVPAMSGQVRLVAELCFPRNARRDPANYYPTVKAVVDALADVGVVPDDNHRWVIGPDMRLGGKHPAGAVVLRIEPVNEEVPV